MNLEQQQERALDSVAWLRVYASRVRQMGFKRLAAEYERQAKATEKWATKVVRREE